MILRSRRIPSAQAAALARLRPRATCRKRSARGAEESGATRKEEALPSNHTHPPKDKGSPAVVRRRRSQVRVRRRTVATEDSDAESDFKTPVRPQQPKEHFRDKPGCTPNGPVRNIYSPIVRFLTPPRNNQQMLDSHSPSVKSREDGVLSPQQFAFGYGCFPPSGEESGDEIFNPYTFMKNAQSQYQTSRPFLRDIPVKTRSTPKATLVLDLDETLVFTSLSLIEDAEYTFRIFFQNHEYKVYMKLRPHVKEFLQSMSKIFEMLVYTSAKKEYAEKILKILDPRKKLFRHCLYQEDCLCVLGHYVKDLGILERDLAKTVALDNAPHTFPYHQMNRITVESWTGDEEDKELLKLIPFLEELSEADDFREVLKTRSALPIDL